MAKRVRRPRSVTRSRSRSRSRSASTNPFRSRSRSRGRSRTRSRVGSSMRRSRSRSRGRSSVFSQAVETQGGNSYSHFKWHKPPNRTLVYMGKNFGVREDYVYNYSDVIQSTIGLQGYGTLSRPEFEFNDIQTMYNNMNNTFSFGTGPSRTLNMYLESCTSRYVITNTTNTPITMWIYDIVAKRDTGTDEDPSKAWVNGLANQKVAGTTPTPSYPTATPFRVDAVNQMYSIKKVSKVPMQIGTEHVHTVSLRPNRIVHGALLREMSSGGGTNSIQRFAGLTHYTLIVILGQAGYSLLGAGLSNSYGPATVRIISNKTYKAYGFVAGQRIDQYENNLNTSGTVQAINEFLDTAITMSGL